MTTIEWAATKNDDGTFTAGRTWNPLSGCTRASAGCDMCYAATMTLRLAAMGQEKYQGLAVRLPNGRAAFNGTIKLDEAALEKPFSWKKPTTVFVNSMSDLFHKDVPETFIRRVFDVMADTPQHTYQVLTKRPERMADVLQRYYAGTAAWSNIWCGTSIENMAVEWRSNWLRQVPAVVRFISAEPLLGPLALDLTWIHWLIAGAESGHGARPADLDWFRGLRDQCQSAGVAFFLKQFAHNGRKQPLPELDGRQWTEMPEVTRC
jgi:protein gp37